MKVSIRDAEALHAVTPQMLSIFARWLGWTRGEAYRKVSYIYTGPQLPEIIIPRKREIGDYASVVAELIEIFAGVAGQDQLTLYSELVSADCDKIRIRAVDQEDDSSLSLEAGADVMEGALNIVLAAACSIGKSRPVYRPRANKEATEYLKRMRLGHTSRGSYVITLLGPPYKAQSQSTLYPDTVSPYDPMGRKVTKRLNQALQAVREAIDATRIQQQNAFRASVDKGVSANLCEALATLTDRLAQLTITVAWAPTFPLDVRQSTVRFTPSDRPFLKEAGGEFRRRDVLASGVVSGYVRELKREKDIDEGTVTLRTPIDDTERSITAILQESDYERAGAAHLNKEQITIKGDPERSGTGWKLLNAKIVDNPPDSE